MGSKWIGCQKQRGPAIASEKLLTFLDANGTHTNVSYDAIKFRDVFIQIMNEPRKM